MSRAPILLSVLTLAFAFVMALTADSSALAAPSRKVALVVGVSHYEHAAALAHTLNDANDLSAALKQMGFDVETVSDPTRGLLEAAVRRYGERSVGADVSVFHYSGHALEASGRNWLLPSTMKLNSERDLPFEAVDLGMVLGQTEGAARVSITFLDACRENPFGLGLTASNRRLASQGLAQVDLGATGALIAFSAAPGQVAYDGDGRNSPFTAALLKYLQTPGLEIRAMLSRVTKEVSKATGGKQRPWENSSLEGDFYFVPPTAGTGGAPSDSVMNPNVEALFWDSIKTSMEPADYRAYIEKFPNGVFVKLAQNRLAALLGGTSALALQLRNRLAAFSLNEKDVEDTTQTYLARPFHKALAATFNGAWRMSGRDNPQIASENAMEACQIYFNRPCSLVAVDESIIAPSEPQDMPRTKYAGLFDPDRIPMIDKPLRVSNDVVTYRYYVGPKAIALHPSGRLFIVTNATPQRLAEETALSECKNDSSRRGAREPCYLYAIGDQVVLPARLTEPRSSQ
jgi:hypothetical protein